VHLASERVEVDTCECDRRVVTLGSATHADRDLALDRYGERFCHR
jgi:hypothetical protein